MLLYARVISEFERSALEVLTGLHKSDPDRSKRLVTRPLATWNGTSVYKLADDANSMQVKTHDCLQASLDEMWHGKLSTNTTMWKVRLRAIQKN